MAMDHATDRAPSGILHMIHFKYSYFCSQKEQGRFLSETQEHCWQNWECSTVLLSYVLSYAFLCTFLCTFLCSYAWLTHVANMGLPREDYTIDSFCGAPRPTIKLLQRSGRDCESYCGVDPVLVEWSVCGREFTKMDNNALTVLYGILKGN